MSHAQTGAPLAWTVHSYVGHQLGKVTWKGGRDLIIAAVEEIAYVLQRELWPLLEKPDVGAELTRYFADLRILTKGRFRGEPVPRYQLLRELDLRAEMPFRAASDTPAARALHADRDARYLHNAFPAGLAPAALLEGTQQGKIAWEPTGVLGRPIYHARGVADGNSAKLSFGCPEPGVYLLLVEAGFQTVPKRVKQYDGPKGRCVLGALWDYLEHGSDI